MPTPTWTYDPAPPKPHLHPLVAPSGRVLTRADTPDHPWQRGVWFSVKFINGENFWEEMDDHGTQHHRDDHTVEWLRPDGSVVLVEDRQLAEVDDRTIDWTTTLTPSVDVELDRTPYQGWGGYSGLAFRGAGDWHGTRIATETTEGKDVIGEPSRWCDLAGPDAGVTILDHPDNPRHPTPWYGDVANELYLTDDPTNFVNAAFLFHEPMHVDAGSQLRFRFRLVVHGGLPDWSAEATTAAWGAFAEA
ncbi:MAG: PmoA family protein [Acidimicrobiales bacterium]|nr:PmoA family protein [Acidimicrobiales bacterium]